MAEQRFCKPQVGGSIPLASSKNSTDDSTSSRLTELLLSPPTSASVTESVTIFAFKDCDYDRFYEGEGYLNDHLKREFSARIGKERKISLFQKLTVVLKHFKVTVTAKEQQEEKSDN